LEYRQPLARPSDWAGLQVARDEGLGQRGGISSRWYRVCQTQPGLGRFGSVDVSPIWRINSGLTYSLFATNVAHSATMLARNPGYVRSGGGGQSASLFFDERGSDDFKGYALFDLALNYSIPVWKDLRPWLQLQVFNLFNNQKLIQWDTSVTPDPNSPLDANGQRTGYIAGSNFGKATEAAHYPVWAPGENGGRTFRMAFGVRF
jgi:hypothetical protein